MKSACLTSRTLNDSIFKIVRDLHYKGMRTKKSLSLIKQWKENHEEEKMVKREALLGHLDTVKLVFNDLNLLCSRMDFDINFN